MEKEVKLSTDQMKAVMELLNISMDYADNIYRFLKAHGLDEIEGCWMSISVDPKLKFTAKCVRYGDVDSDSGMIGVYRGDEGNGFYTHSSKEYVELFKQQSKGSGNPEGNHVEKELPPDGLWLSAFDDCDPVDSGVSVNDMAITG